MSAFLGPPLLRPTPGPGASSSNQHNPHIMHRAIGMRRLGPRAALFSPSRHVLRAMEDHHLRRTEQHFCNISRMDQAAPLSSSAAAPTITRPHGVSPAMTAQPVATGMRPMKPMLLSAVSLSRRRISSSAPVLKGRRGGASATLQRPSR